MYMIRHSKGFYVQHVLIRNSSDLITLHLGVNLLHQSKIESAHYRGLEEFQSFVQNLVTFKASLKD